LLYAKGRRASLKQMVKFWQQKEKRQHSFQLLGTKVLLDMVVSRKKCIVCQFIPNCLLNSWTVTGERNSIGRVSLTKLFYLLGTQCLWPDLLYFLCNSSYKISSNLITKYKLVITIWTCFAFNIGLVIFLLCLRTPKDSTQTDHAHCRINLATVNS
jgi:hypothetical protein